LKVGLNFSCEVYFHGAVPLRVHDGDQVLAHPSGEVDGEPRLSCADEGRAVDVGSAQSRGEVEGEEARSADEPLEADTVRDSRVVESEVIVQLVVVEVLLRGVLVEAVDVVAVELEPDLLDLDLLPSLPLVLGELVLCKKKKKKMLACTRTPVKIVLEHMTY
jgi:hypothetical protein